MSTRRRSGCVLRNAALALPGSTLIFAVLAVLAGASLMKYAVNNRTVASHATRKGQ